MARTDKPRKSAASPLTQAQIDAASALAEQLTGTTPEVPHSEPDNPEVIHPLMTETRSPAQPHPNDQGSRDRPRALELSSSERSTTRVDFAVSAEERLGIGPGHLPGIDREVIERRAMGLGQDPMKVTQQFNATWPEYLVRALKKHGYDLGGERPAVLAAQYVIEGLKRDNPQALIDGYNAVAKSQGVQL